MNNRPIIIWLFTGCLLIFSMVVIGGITRLTRSGLSMVEWKPTGSLPPMNNNEWQVSFEKYKATPEFRLINSSFTLSDYKKIFWWEYIHRFIGRSIGFVFIIPFFWFLYRRKFNSVLLRKMLILLLLGASQGVLGWIMVKSGLDKVPHVSHYLLAAHLSTAFITFGFTFWYALDLIWPEKTSSQFSKPRKSALIFLVVVFVQIIYGAFVAGLKAGHIYTNFPKMGEAWIAHDVTSMQPFWKNLFENGAGVQFIHRVIAFFLVFLVLIIFVRSRRANVQWCTKMIACTLLIVVSLQVILGIVTLLFSVPVALGSLHQAMAFIVFSCAITFVHRTR